MQSAEHVNQVSEASIDGRASRELAKLIIKLRWIGSEDEAKRLEAKLRSCPHACVLAAPLETD